MATTDLLLIDTDISSRDPDSFFPGKYQMLAVVGEGNCCWFGSDRIVFGLSFDLNEVIARNFCFAHWF